MFLSRALIAGDWVEAYDMEANENEKTLCQIDPLNGLCKCATEFMSGPCADAVAGKTIPQEVMMVRLRALSDHGRHCPTLLTMGRRYIHDGCARGK